MAGTQHISLAEGANMDIGGGLEARAVSNARLPRNLLGGAKQPTNSSFIAR